MSILSFLLIAATGSAGACSRYLCQQFGLSVWSVNVIASVAIGALVAIAPPASLPLLVGGGYLAGFSTVSGQVAAVLEKPGCHLQHIYQLSCMVVVGATLALLSFYLIRWGLL